MGQLAKCRFGSCVIDAAQKITKEIKTLHAIRASGVRIVRLVRFAAGAGPGLHDNVFNVGTSHSDPARHQMSVHARAVTDHVTEPSPFQRHLGLGVSRPTAIVFQLFYSFDEFP